MLPASAKALFDLLFNEGESACVSPDPFAYRSIDLSDLDFEVVELISNTSGEPKSCLVSELLLVSLNPIVGLRNDDNCTGLRTFLVEVDTGPLAEQMKYIEDLKMPYSACVFSGNKSLHFAITLDKDLPSLDIYKFYSRWILNVMTRADQQTLNPSRSIRFPGHFRDGKEQKLLKINNRIGLEDLQAWLSQYHGLKPNVHKAEKRQIAVGSGTLQSLPGWVLNDLLNGIDSSKGRNARWFAIGYEFGLQGFEDDDTVSILEQYFEAERDFTRREWEYTLRHAVTKAQTDHS